MAYTTTKSTVECYKIRHDKTFYWADITVDHNDNKGRISIASDFGSYQYYWGACGTDFKQFLCNLGIDYAADKFNADRWFDAEQTYKMYKEQILEDRRGERIEADLARKLYDSVKIFESEIISYESFGMEVQNHAEFMNYYDYSPSVCYGITPQFRNFWKEIWPVFIGELKKELLSEAFSTGH